MKLPVFAAMAAIGLFTSSCEQKQPVKAPAQSAVETASVKPVALIETNGGSVRRVGELIKASSENSVGDAHRWHIDTSGVTIPTDADDSVMKQNAEVLRDQGAIVILPNADEKLYDIAGQAVYFASYEGVIRVVLSVASNTDDGVQIDTAGYTFTIRDGPDKPIPPVDPPDTPTPPDSPPVPPEGFGLGTQVKAWLASVPVASRGEATLIKQILMANANLAAEGKFRTIAEMQIAIGAGLTAGIRDKLGWAGFGMSLMTALDKLQKSKDIETPADLGRAISEVTGAM